jgi:peptidoglycan/LPS O-acetylase OafA/YrhL
VALAPCPRGVAYETYQATSYFRALDGLRAASIAAVLWHHSTPRQLDGALGRGHLGVRLFFAISGFLITTLLLREVARTGQLRLGAFWFRRAVRLLPLYYVVLLCFVGFALQLPALAPERGHFFASLPFFVTHTANWFVNFGAPHPILFAFGWSLSTEQQFYAFWPLLLKFSFRLIRSPRYALLFACAALLTMLVADQLAERRLLPWLAETGLLSEVVTSFVASIAFGALWAAVLESPRGFGLCGSVLGHVLTAPLLGLWLVLWVVWPPSDFVWFEAVLGTFVAACVVSEGKHFARLLSLPVLAHIGKVSYGMYLFHVAVIGALKASLPAPDQHPLILFGSAFGCTWLLAALSERYFESPLRMWWGRQPSAPMPKLRSRLRNVG